MWGRANMAAVTLLLLLGGLCIFTQGEAKNTGQNAAADAEAEAILEKATAWLWSQRDKDAGWGNDTHQVLLALRLGNLSRDNNVPSPAGLELQLSAKQMELEIVLLLWRHREVSSSPVRLAKYTLALNALCMDPRHFHGHDLISTLQHYEPPTDYEFAFTILAACGAQAHVRKRQMRRLLDIVNSAQNHNIDTVAMVIMTLNCITQDHRHRNLHHSVRKPSQGLAHQQRRDGSFGDVRVTALVMQALEEVENEPVDNWNRTAALMWLSSQQKPDGSFNGDVRLTAETLLGVARRGVTSIRTLDCGQGLMDSSPPRISTIKASEVPLTDNRNSLLSTPSSSLENHSSNLTGKSIDDKTISTTISPVFVNVSYTLWVGTNVNETYSLVISAPKNESFFDVMFLAAEMNPHFQFAASEWPNGHYVHTLAGYKEEPMSYHYWLLYRLPTLPYPASPPGNQYVAPGGVDDLLISEGDHYLFWYKKL